MKPSLAQAAVFLPSLVLALPSFPPSSLGSVAKDITAVAGTTGPEHITIHFRAPCQGCFIGTDDGLELTLEIDAAEEECSARAPRLNGLPLSLAPGNQVAQGQISFISKPSNGLAEKEVHASWQSTCLQGEASILSVRFDDITGQNNANDVSGFTTSFKQKGKPAVLRLQDKPIDHLSSQDICDEWLRPEDQSLSIVPVMAGAATSIDTQIEIQIAEFEHLRGEMEQLQERVREHHHRIMSLLKQEFLACSNLKCLWKTAVSKAPTIKKLITLCFSHHNRHSAGCTDGEGQKACSTKDQDDSFVGTNLPEPAQPPNNVEEVHIDDIVPPPSPQEPPQQLHDEINEPPSHEGGEEGHPRPPFEEEHPHPPFEGDHPHPPFDGEHPHPPFDHPHPPFDENHPPPPFAGKHPHPPFGPPFRGDHPPFGPPHRPPQGFPPPPPGHHGPPPFGPPGPPPGIPRFGPFGHEWGGYSFEARLALTVTSLILLIILSGLTFRLIRKSSWYRDPRRQADRAARREERRTRKLYRKAACKHKWATWWKHYRRQCSNTDYEEKREMVLEQEGLLEDVMQNEIRTLRNASDLVRDLVRVEEGRARFNVCNHAHHPPYPYSPAEHAGGIGSSNFSEVPPLYVAPPPRYEEELEGELTVVDGFRYTPSNTDDTPDSSIIDCSSRLSLETGGSTIASKDARD
ncbi:hypothetical protein A1O3_10222 [Capronia epimyces CBS 606.96]|uniref:Uncharacterized protein n=1 Tax=Capronia epimyces CBS 606.96 TaxID=1182542 RepID=W9Y3M5_9EURO|nr:uncharacterized protein A1O3_10222 [Capronia epimyces CBS 606.96]EXJ77064.1 hypothetical protein A1O3_10222 [Capronia epimyces CBS 606.96]